MKLSEFLKNIKNSADGVTIQVVFFDTRSNEAQEIKIFDIETADQTVKQAEMYLFHSMEIDEGYITIYGIKRIRGINIWK